MFYLQKRVPADLKHRYGRPFIRKSLRTKDPKQANRLASSLVDGLKREWLDLRFGISEETPASDLLLLQREQESMLSDACADYCRMKGRTDNKKFRQLAERVPVPIDSIRLVQNECIKLDDDIRWIIAAVSYSSMRLAEAAGLRISDLHIQNYIPFVRLKEHASRRLHRACVTKVRRK